MQGTFFIKRGRNLSIILLKFLFPFGKQKGSERVMPSPILFCSILITVGVVRLPIPRIAHHILQGMHGVPTKLRLSLGRIGIAGRDIAGTAIHNTVRNSDLVDAAEGLDHIQHAVSDARAQIENTNAVFLVLQCRNVSGISYIETRNRMNVLLE